MLLYLALVAVALAVLAAVIHPFVLLLGLLPFDISGFLRVLEGARIAIVDTLFWGFLITLLMAVAMIARSRLFRGNPGQVPTSGDGRDGSGLRPIARPVRIAVAITALDDAEATAEAVEEFKTQSGVIGVVVIDNDSTDDTAALAAAAGARVVRESRRGYGYACMRGLAEALNFNEAEVIVLTEGDGTFVASDLSKFDAYIDQADMVLGTRVVPGLVEEGSQMDHFFTWGNIAVSALLRLRFWNSRFLGAARLSDVGCTYRAIRRESLQRILPHLAVGGSYFSPHMMVVALEKGLSIIEIPVTFRRRVGQSKGASRSLAAGLLVGVSMIWHILTYSPRRERDVARSSRKESDT